MKRLLIGVWGIIQIIYIVIILTEQSLGITVVRGYDLGIIGMAIIIGWGMLIYRYRSASTKILVPGILEHEYELSVRRRIPGVPHQGIDKINSCRWPMIGLITWGLLNILFTLIYSFGLPRTWYTSSYAQFVKQVSPVAVIPEVVYRQNVSENITYFFAKSQPQDIYTVPNVEDLTLMTIPIERASIMEQSNNGWRTWEAYTYGTELAFVSPDNQLTLQIKPHQSGTYQVLFEAWVTALGANIRYELKNQDKIIWRGETGNLDCIEITSTMESKDRSCLKEQRTIESPMMDLQANTEYTFTLHAFGDYRKQFSEEYNVFYGGYATISNLRLDMEHQYLPWYDNTITRIEQNHGSQIKITLADTRPTGLVLDMPYQHGWQIASKENGQVWPANMSTQFWQIEPLICSDRPMTIIFRYMPGIWLGIILSISWMSFCIYGVTLGLYSMQNKSLS